MGTVLENSLDELGLDTDCRGAFGVLADYWQEIRGEAPCPPKTAFQPTRIAEILPQIALMEVLEDGSDVIYRLYAAGLRERSKHDHTGESVFDSLPANTHESILAAYHLGRDSVAGCFLEVDLEFPCGETRRVNALFLPLSDEKGVARFFINLLYLNVLEPLPADEVNENLLYIPRGMQMLDLGNNSSGRSQ